MQNVHNPLEIILKYINEKGITEKECLIACKINTSFLTDWKNGRVKTPSYDKMIKIANFFDISLDYLLTGKEHISYNANNVSNSAIAQGHHSTAINGDAPISAEIKKILSYYERLNPENRDIIIGEMVKLIKEQSSCT